MSQIHYFSVLKAFDLLTDLIFANLLVPVLLSFVKFSFFFVHVLFVELNVRLYLFVSLTVSSFSLALFGTGLLLKVAVGLELFFLLKEVLFPVFQLKIFPL